MTLNNNQVTIFASRLQASLKKALVFAGPQTVNRDYEGSIQQVGDSVRIRSISRPTVGTYTKGVTTITPEQLTDAERTLLIDQSKYFAFEVDDIDIVQHAGSGDKQEAAVEAAYAIADDADQYVAGLYADAATANEIGTTAITTSALAVTGLRELMVKLDEANVPRAGRYVIVPPWYHGLLAESQLFTSLADSGSTETLRNGIVGRAFGFNVFMSNNVENVTGDDYRVCAGYTGAITFATQINKVESYRPEDSFSDALKGLNLYGSKLVRPNGVATLIASIS